MREIRIPDEAVEAAAKTLRDVIDDGEDWPVAEYVEDAALVLTAAFEAVGLEVKYSTTIARGD